MSSEIVLKKLSTRALPLLAVLGSMVFADGPVDLSGLTENTPVSVREGDKWTPATFEGMEGEKYLVRYSDGTEEAVTASRLKPTGPAPAPTTAPGGAAKPKPAGFKIGSSVEAKDNAFWRAAKVINRRGDWYLLQWTEFGGSREWVEPWRIRRPGDSYDLQGWYTNPKVRNGEDPPRPTPGEPTDPKDNPNAPKDELTRKAAEIGVELTPAAMVGRDVLPVAPETWEYKPTAGQHIGMVTPTVLPPLLENFEYRGLRIAGTSALLMAGSNFDQSKTGVVKVNIAMNATAPYELAGGPMPMAISPAGTFIAARSNNFGGGGRSRLDVFKIVGTKANRLISYVPESDKDDIFDAQFVDEKLLLTCTDDQLACWDFATATRQWEMPVKGGGTIARAPDGKTFAVSTTEGIVLIDATAGKVLGLLDGDPVNDLSFTNDGKRLYGSTPASISVWDIEKGQPIYTLGMPNGAGGKLVAIDSDFALVGPYLFSTAKKCFIWKYDNGAANGNTVPLAASGGRVFTIYQDRKMRMLVSAPLPQPSAVKAAKDAKPAEMAIQPGSAVSIELQNEGSDADKQIALAAITRRLEAAGVKVQPGSPVRILAKTDVSTENRQYVMHGFGIPFGRTENVTITNKTTTLCVVSGDKTLWSVSRGTSNDPGMFVHVRTATLQETINQMGGVDAKWIAETPVPTMLAGFNDLSTLPSSRWALGGVKDK